MSTETIKAQIAALEAALKAAQMAESDDRRTRLKAFKKQWRFTMTPVNDTWEKIHDDTIKQYRLTGKLLNADEYKAIGGDDRSGGGMNYLYNTVTRKVIKQDGGGNIYVDCKRDNAAEIYAALGAAIHASPESADVTAIVTGNPHFTW